MTRRLAVAAPLVACITVAALASSSAAATGQCGTGDPMTLSGQTNMGYVDVNRDGVLNSDDCVINGWGTVNDDGSTDGMAAADVCFRGTQGSNTPQILGCDSSNRDAMAMVDLPGGYGSVIGNMYSDPGIFFASSPFESMNAVAGGNAGGITAGFPLPVIFGQVREDGQGDIIGDGFLCNDAGPAVMADVKGVSGVARFFPLTSGGIDYQCANLPLETNDFNNLATQMFPVCFPVANGTAPFGYEGGTTNFVELQLSRLPACGGEGAPSANEWGLMALAAALLAGGTWVLRRRGFAASLPAV